MLPKNEGSLLHKSITEVIEIADNPDHCEEYMQYNYSEKLNLIDTGARDEFSSSTPIMIKFAAGINYYGEIINKIKKIMKQKHALCVT